MLNAALFGIVKERECSWRNGDDWQKGEMVIEAPFTKV